MVESPERVTSEAFSELVEERNQLARDLELLATEMVYHGNSVAHWEQKARAYKAIVGRLCDALSAAGYPPYPGRPPEPGRSLEEAVAALVAERDHLRSL